MAGRGGSFAVPRSPGGIPRFDFPGVPPGNVEEALDRIEALAEWAGAVSGSPASEGGLWKSIRAYAARRSLLDALDERIARETAFLTPGERRDIVRAGTFLPPEAHSRLLSTILGIDPEAAPRPSGRGADGASSWRVDLDSWPGSTYRDHSENPLTRGASAGTILPVNVRW